MNTKPWYTSWTLWANAVGGAILGVGAIFEQAGVTAAWLAPVMLVGNVLLRFKTTQPIGS